MKKVTILIPCFNEESSLPELYKALDNLISSFNNYLWEVLMVNDGSTDNTMEIIRNLRMKDQRICYINLSRNFGKENAMLAGFDYATGDCMVIMDADLQHPPCVVKEMLKYWEEGYDDIYAKRRSRGKESWLRKKLSLFYYRLLQSTTRVQILQNVGDFRLIDRKCIDVLKEMRECERYTKGMFCWIGFKKKEILFEQGDRVAGVSSWSYWSLFKLGIEGITSFTTAPLRLSTVLGLVVSISAFLYMIFVLIKTIIYGEVVQGYPTIVILMLFLGGVNLLSLGIIGEYIGRIFNEAKLRPIYIISDMEL